MSEHNPRALEPQDIDEQRYLELRVVADSAVLRRRPQSNEGCGNCRYYLEPDSDVSYCWHPKLRILVGDDWWCQWWDAGP